MKFTVAAIATFAGLVFAADLPSCAKDCFDKAATKAGCKSIEDTECICSLDTQQNIGRDTEFTNCLSTACSSDDLVKANEETFAVCESPSSSSGSSSSSSSSSPPSSSSTSPSGSEAKDKGNAAAGTTVFGAAAFAAILFAL